MSDREEQRNRDIERLTNHLHRLSIELQNTSEQLQRLQGTPSNQNNTQDKESTRARRKLQVGDRVLITNNYRGARGVVGTIVRVTEATVVIDPDNRGPEIRRYKDNVVHCHHEKERAIGNKSSKHKETKQMYRTITK